jgi:thiol-disulfide isomerase/thioredoxin
MENYIL